MRYITNEKIVKFGQRLAAEEKSAATVEKYLRDVAAFAAYIGGRGIDKCAVLAYKEHLVGRYAPSSVNSILSSLNSFFSYCEWFELRVRALKIQRCVFADKERELTKDEYRRLVRAARCCGRERIGLVMQTLCACGIRVSELKYITVEAVQKGHTVIRGKGKIRRIFLPESLCRMLLRYTGKNKITGGAVFVTKNGNPLDRSNIWNEMKKLCESAGVAPEKVFPHNLRHLFARTYYSIEKDIVRLADILGHSSVNTTRIYTMESGDIHRRQIDKLGLLLC